MLAPSGLPQHQHQQQAGIWRPVSLLHPPRLLLLLQHQLLLLLLLSFPQATSLPPPRREHSTVSGRAGMAHAPLSYRSAVPSLPPTISPDTNHLLLQSARKASASTVRTNCPSPSRNSRPSRPASVYKARKMWRRRRSSIRATTPDYSATADSILIRT